MEIIWTGGGYTILLCVGLETTAIIQTGGEYTILLNVGLDIKKDVEGKTWYALFLSGGGTARAAAFAASKLGLERIYFNRTPEKAMDLAGIWRRRGEKS